MEKVYVASDNIISSLGFNTLENCSNIRNGITGISEIDDPEFISGKFYGSRVNSTLLDAKFSALEKGTASTRFEKLAILSVSDAALKTTAELSSNNTIFILSTTKGNIDILQKNETKTSPSKALHLWDTSNKIAKYFSNPNQSIVVSNACVSGVVALNTASRLIRSGQYENAVVIGADIMSNFVVSGFLSFQSLSNGPCKPFDKNRTGLSLGEGCGTIILTGNANHASNPRILVGGGFSSNDANHISGPSRTGEGLLLAVQKTLTDPYSSDIKKPDYISAHGTATPYNDEMEAIAFSRAGLKDVPVNSLKGYWGHTLGAAGVIETAAALYSLQNNILFKTMGYQEMGISEDISIISETHEQTIHSCLKTASGFGGSNAGILFYKE